MNLPFLIAAAHSNGPRPTGRVLIICRRMRQAKDGAWKAAEIVRTACVACYGGLEAIAHFREALKKEKEPLGFPVTITAQEYHAPGLGAERRGQR